MQATAAVFVALGICILYSAAVWTVAGGSCCKPKNRFVLLDDLELVSPRARLKQPLNIDELGIASSESEDDVMSANN